MKWEVLLKIEWLVGEPIVRSKKEVDKNLVSWKDVFSTCLCHFLSIAMHMARMQLWSCPWLYPGVDP